MFREALIVLTSTMGRDLEPVSSSCTVHPCVVGDPAERLAVWKNNMQTLFSSRAKRISEDDMKKLIQLEGTALESLLVYLLV